MTSLIVLLYALINGNGLSDFMYDDTIQLVANSYTHRQ